MQEKRYILLGKGKCMLLTLVFDYKLYTGP